MQAIHKDPCLCTQREFYVAHHMVCTNISAIRSDAAVSPFAPLSTRNLGMLSLFLPCLLADVQRVGIFDRSAFHNDEDHNHNPVSQYCS